MKIFIIAYCFALAVIFYTGYICGTKHTVINTMQTQLNSYKKERKFKNDIQNSSDYTICRALGGLRDSCKIFKSSTH